VKRALLTTALVAGAASVWAHTRSVSYSSWEVTPGGARVEVRITNADGLEVESAAGGPLPAALGEQVQLAVDGVACTAAAVPSSRPAPAPWVAYGWSLTCPPAGSAVLTTLLRPVPGHLHFARVRFADGTIQERLLSGTDTRWTLGPLGTPGAAPDAAGTSVTSAMALGLRRGSSADHLVFLLALLLVAGSLREVVGLVAAFTIAESTALVAAVLGSARLEPAAVGALSGLSVALVAAGNAWLLAGRDRTIPRAAVGAVVALAVAAAAGVGAVPPLTLAGIALFAACHFGLLARAARPATPLTLVAFAFGLVHGLGFARALEGTGLPGGQLLPALLGFNLGGTIGQLALVSVSWTALRLVASVDDGRWALVTARVGSAVACGLGVFWLVTRAGG
jgi:HupE / UreJ protein